MAASASIRWIRASRRRSAGRSASPRHRHLRLRPRRAGWRPSIPAAWRRIMAMRFKAKLIIPAAALVATAGCAPVDPGLGEAVRYDMAVQTVNPDPVYPEGGAQPGDSGVKGAEAVKAYRKGETKEIKVQQTSNVSGVGGPQ